MTLYTRARTRESYLEEIEAPLLSVLGVSAQEALLYSPVSSIGRFVELSNEMDGEPVGIGGFDEGFGERRATSPMVSAADARKRIADEGLDLAVPDAGIRQGALDVLIARKKDERRRQDILSRAPGGFFPTAATFGVGVAASLLDPINVGVSFLPVIGPARYAMMLERAGSTIGRMGVRAGVGALEGAAGAALVEPIVLAAATQEQADYGLVDTLFNIALGTALGGGLHVGAGAIGDALSRGRPWQTARAVEPLPRVLEGVEPSTREALLRTSVAQAVSGRVVDVEPLIRLPHTMERLSELQLDQFRRDARVRAARAEESMTRLAGEEARAAAGLDAAQRALRDLEPLRQEVDQLRTEAASARERAAAVEPALDPATRARLDAIETELGTKGLSRPARIRLMQEKRTIEESLKAGMTEDQAARLRASLEQEAKGLEKALAKKERSLKSAEAKAEKASASAGKSLSAVNREVEQLGARSASQAGDILNVAGRAIRDLARDGYRLRLTRAEARDFAGRLIAADDEAAPGILREITEALSARSAELHGTRQVEAAGQETRLIEDARRIAGPEGSRLADFDASRQADEIAARAKTPDEQMVEESLTDVLDDLGRMTDAMGDDAILARELAPFDELVEFADTAERAIRAAAECRIRRG